MPKSWLGWIALLVVVLLIWKHPTSAGHAVNHAWNSVSAFIGGATG